MRNFPYFFDLPQPVSLICPGPRRCVGAVVREAGIRAPMEILLERESVLALGQRAGRGAGQVVLLRGEAGVGKTAVIGHFIAGLDERVRVLRGSCDPLATPRPLGPLIDMLAQLPGPQAGGLAEIYVGSHTCCGHWVAPPRPPARRASVPAAAGKTVGRARSWPGHHDYDTPGATHVSHSAPRRQHPEVG
jgi:hypothetical protein